MPPLFTNVINTRALPGVYSPVTAPTPNLSRRRCQRSTPVIKCHAHSYGLRHDLLVLLERDVISRHFAGAATGGSCGGKHAVTLLSAPWASTLPHFPTGVLVSERFRQLRGVGALHPHAAQVPMAQPRPPAALPEARERRRRRAACRCCRVPVGPVTLRTGLSLSALPSWRLRPSGWRRRGGAGYLLPLQRQLPSIAGAPPRHTTQAAEDALSAGAGAQLSLS